MVEALAILAIGIPWLGAALVRMTSDERPTLQHALAVVFSLAGAVVTVGLIPLRTAHNVLAFPLGSTFGQVTFLPDGLAIFLAVVAAVIGSLAVVFSIDYMRGERQLGRYYAYVLFFIGAMVGLVLSSNLLLMFVFWEITALCSYALISFHNDDPKAVAGGIKALIMTQVGGVGLLAGALLLYSYQGTYDIPTFLGRPDVLPASVLGLMAFGFLVAAAAKSAQFPFQTWLPDAMEAPTPISALIHAATMVNAGVYLLARFAPVFQQVPGWSAAVVAVGVITALMAAVMALVSNDLKRVLAYSTVSQLGYMVYAIGVGGVLASQFHLLSHAIFKALLFLSAGAVIHAIGTRDMREMGSLGRQMPLVRTVMVIGGLALAGIPGFNGFWSKELILEAGLESGPWWAYAVMVLGAGLTALYTVRFLTLVFYGPRRQHAHAHDAGSAMTLALLPLALGTLSSWALAGPFGRFVETALPPTAHVPHETGEVLRSILTSPWTYLALGVVVLGMAAWFQRARLTALIRATERVGRAAADGFGFEAINRGVVTVTRGAAEALRGLQTGLLGWNMVGIVFALAAVLAILAWGGA